MSFAKERQVSFEPQIPVSSHIEISGLRPEILDSNGAVISRGNLVQKLPDIQNAFDNRPWIKDLIDDVRKNKRVAQVLPVLGGITIFAAVVGIELGIRHGKDLKEIHDLLEKVRQPKRK